MGDFKFTDYQEFDSSAISRAWYNKDAEELVVNFKNGSLAGYRDFLPTDWTKFLNATSIGQHYAWYIKDSFGGMSVSLDTTFHRVQEPTGNSEAGGSVGKYRVSATLTTVVFQEVEADDVLAALEAFNEFVKNNVKGEYTLKVKEVKEV